MSERSIRTPRRKKQSSRKHDASPESPSRDSLLRDDPNATGPTRQIEFERYTPTLATGWSRKKFEQSFGDTLNSVDRKVDIIIVFPIELDNRDGKLQNPHFERDESRKSRSRRLEVMKRLYAVGLELTQATDMDQSTWIVRVSAPTKLLMRTAEEMQMKARLRRKEVEVEQNQFAGFAEFECRQIDSFEIGHTKQFGSTERMRLILHLMKTALGNPSDQHYEQIIEKYVRDGHFKVVPLHDPNDRSDLLRLWVHGGGGTWWPFQPQPLTKIRDYFGEEIALYFALVEHFWLSLRLPMFLGFVTFLINVGTGEPLNAGVLVYTFFMNLWAIYFLESWKRKQSVYQLEWDCALFQSTAEDRLDFKGKLRRSRIMPFRYDPHGDKMVENLVPQFLFMERFKRYLVTIPVNCLAILGVLSCATAVVFLNFWIINSGKLGPVGGALGGIVNTATIMTLTVLYEGLAYKLNDYENHQTQNDYLDSLTFKKFIFQFCNNYTALLSVAFLMNHVTVFTVHPTCEKGPDEPQDCTTELSSLIMSTMLTAIIVGNAVESVVPYVQHRILEKKMEDESKESLNAMVNDNQAVKLHPSAHELEAALPMYEGTFNDYLEIAITFGYVTLFACVFPLGPLLAWINSTIEIRSDAFKMVKVHQRPLYSGAADIGSWYSIFSILALASTLVNVLILASTKMYHKVGWANETTESKLLCAVILEHILFFLKFICADMISDEPEDLADNKLRLEKKVAKLKKDEDTARARALVKRRTLNIMESISESIVATLEDVDVKRWRLRMIKEKKTIGPAPPEHQQAVHYLQRDKTGRLVKDVDEEMGLRTADTTEYRNRKEASAGAVFTRYREATSGDRLAAQTHSQGALDHIEGDPTALDDSDSEANSDTEPLPLNY